MNCFRWNGVLLALAAAPCAPAAEPERLELHVVPVPVRSYRLLAMSMDPDGFIWAGSIHRTIHRYDPRTGAVESVPLPGAARRPLRIAGQRRLVPGVRPGGREVRPARHGPAGRRIVPVHRLLPLPRRRRRPSAVRRPGRDLFRAADLEGPARPFDF